jgi:hypothetical protein
MGTGGAMPSGERASVRFQLGRTSELAGTPSAQTEPRAAGDGPPGPKPERAADLLPSVTAPKGGGAVRGLDEKLSVNAATGTCATSVRIPLSPGRSGFTPSLSLSYDSGSGNGSLGFGWSIGLPEITRKTDKGLPRYCHGDESDVFVLTGADDLVPVVNPDGSRETLSRVLYGASFEIEFYRPRVEGLFSRIERWTETATGHSHWRTISRDNVTTLYGTDPASQVADPSDPDRVFSWHICRSWDDKGNAACYTYNAEDSAGIDPAAASEANRTARTRAAQIYLTAIRYGNVQPYFPDFSAAARNPSYTFLVSVTETAYRQDGSGLTVSSMPPLTDVRLIAGTLCAAALIWAIARLMIGGPVAACLVSCGMLAIALTATIGWPVLWYGTTKWQVYPEVNTWGKWAFVALALVTVVALSIMLARAVWTVLGPYAKAWRWVLPSQWRSESAWPRCRMPSLRLASPLRTRTACSRSRSSIFSIRCPTCSTGCSPRYCCW